MTNVGENKTFKPSKSESERLQQGWTEQPIDIAAATKLETIVSIRLEAETSALIRRGARLSGKTRSQFLRDAGVKEANEAIQRHESRPAVVVRRLEVAHVPSALTDSNASMRSSASDVLETEGSGVLVR